ncbi:TRAP transporter small permease [Sinorhizobium sojae]|nr:TRAP transporter small permease [Sinorhizobium sojae]
MAERLPIGGEQEGDSLLFQLLHVSCTALAGLGGLVVLGAALMVTLSVASATLGLGAIRGEFELVELSCAACASLFLPLCQLARGHVMVDVFTNWLPGAANRTIDAIWTLVFGLAWGLLCWRLFQGMVEVRGYGDRTMLLSAPIWWVYIPAVLGTGLSAVVAALQGLAALFPSTFRIGTSS